MVGKLKYDLTGKRFGKLVVIHQVHDTTGKRALWNCQCDCGRSKVIAGDSIRAVNGTKTCGCQPPRKTHGRSGTAEYGIWKAMIRRCNNVNCREYNNYGSRGITVCERWKKSFSNFFADMGPRPSQRHAIDRIDNNGNYEPENCRWVVPKDNSRNRRSNRHMTLNGVTKCVAEWAEELGIKPAIVSTRLRRGWSEEMALTTPVHPIPWGIKLKPIVLDKAGNPVGQRGT